LLNSILLFRWQLSTDSLTYPHLYPLFTIYFHFTPLLIFGQPLFSTRTQGKANYKDSVQPIKGNCARLSGH